MRTKERATYDLNSDQFKYLKRQEGKILHRVDINELNKRLNEAKKSNIYNTALAVIVGLSCLTILSLIGINF